MRGRSDIPLTPPRTSGAVSRGCRRFTAVGTLDLPLVRTELTMSDTSADQDDRGEVEALGADPDFPTTDPDPDVDESSSSPAEEDDEDVEVSDLP